MLVLTSYIYIYSSLSVYFWILMNNIFNGIVAPLPEHGFKPKSESLPIFHASKPSDADQLHSFHASKRQLQANDVDLLHGKRPLHSNDIDLLHGKRQSQASEPDQMPVFHVSKRQLHSNELHSFHSNKLGRNHSNAQDSDQPIEVAWKHSTLMDSFLVEVLSSILVNLSVIFSWDWSGDNFALQFIPGIALGLIMLCIKDEDYFFPDGSPMVTVLIWSMGGYFSWLHSCVRLVVHAVGFGISLWLCVSSPIPHMIYHRRYPPGVYFGMEAITTSIEHIAVVYVIMPLLPPMNSHGTKFLFPKFKPKSHPDTMAPSNSTIMHAAIVFSVIHWVFWRMLSCEMNPSVLLLLSYLRVFQEKNGIDLSADHSHDQYGSYAQTPKPSIDHWNYCAMGLWGQVIGLVVSLLYAFLFIPRSHKFMMQYPNFQSSKKSSVR